MLPGPPLEAPAERPPGHTHLARRVSGYVLGKNRRGQKGDSEALVVSLIWVLVTSICSVSDNFIALGVYLHVFSINVIIKQKVQRAIKCGQSPYFLRHGSIHLVNFNPTGSVTISWARSPPLGTLDGRERGGTAV